MSKSVGDRISVMYPRILISFNFAVAAGCPAVVRGGAVTGGAEAGAGVDWFWIGGRLSTSCVFGGIGSLPSEAVVGGAIPGRGVGVPGLSAGGKFAMSVKYLAST